MENKLTLEHLAPYLPYGLKILTCKNIEGNSVIEEMTLDYLKEMVEIPIGEKPILRSLSEFQGEDLIELFEIAYNDIYKTVDKELNNFIFHGWDGNDFGLVVLDETFEYGFSMDFERQKDFRFSYRHKGADYPKSFLMIDKLKLFTALFKKHFDVFGLIEKGLAISIHNT